MVWTGMRPLSTRPRTYLIPKIHVFFDELKAGDYPYVGKLSGYGDYQIRVKGYLMVVTKARLKVRFL